MIAVLFALPPESSAFLRLLQNSTRGPADSHTISGTLHGHAVSVLHTGVGEKTTRTRLANFLRAQTPQLLISSGFAGALNDQWRVGDLLLARNFSSAQCDINCRAGNLATVSAVIDSPAERQALAREGADAADMETQFIAEACAAGKIPMIALRAISDTPAAPFPAPPHVLFDVERQRTPAFLLTWYLVRHPSALRKLIGFARRISVARHNLSDALSKICAM